MAKKKIENDVTEVSEVSNETENLKLVSLETSNVEQDTQDVQEVFEPEFEFITNSISQIPELDSTDSFLIKAKLGLYCFIGNSNESSRDVIGDKIVVYPNEVVYIDPGFGLEYSDKVEPRFSLFERLSGIFYLVSPKLENGLLQFENITDIPQCIFRDAIVAKLNIIEI